MPNAQVVTNNNDSGAGSLRDVIANACIGSTITFAANVTGAINLTSGELLIDRNLTINGPGAKILTVQRSTAPGTPAFRILDIAPASVNATISGVTIANGNALGSTGGGGIYNTGTLALSDSTIFGNDGTGGSFGGGGIFNSGGAVTISNSTISGNMVGNNYAGGGIANTGGTVTITNSSISGNSASAGGGIYNFTTGMVNITNSTITSNSISGNSPGGGGVHNVNGGTVRVRNTIIAMNTSANGPDFNGALTSQNFNLIGNNSGAIITPAQPADQIGTNAAPIDPLLGDLQDNGGPTFTHAVLSGSTAIDRGDSGGSGTDQRGFARPLDFPEIDNNPNGDGSDIGAFEAQVLCSYALSVTSQSFAANGGAGMVALTAPNGCSWIVANNNPEFISIDSGTNGNGNGTVQYSVTPNPSNTERRMGTLRIAGQSFAVLQGPQFLDVPESSLFYTEIGKLAARGVTLGCGSGNYCPSNFVTREQMAAFIVRALGELDPPLPESQRFVDVPSSNIFYAFIDRLAALQITLGCTLDHTMYCPAGNVTREQMAAFIIRALGEFDPPTPAGQRFNDVPPENVFYDFIDRMAVRGITQGCNPDHTLYCPGDNVTRAQMAAFLVRAFDL
jgi:hypothetical protein